VVKTRPLIQPGDLGVPRLQQSLRRLRYQRTSSEAPSLPTSIASVSHGWGPLPFIVPCSHYFEEDYRSTICHPWFHYLAPNLPSAQGQKVKILLVSPLDAMIFAFLLVFFVLRLPLHIANNVTTWICNMILPTFC
jgi:hypothetical protein